MVILLEATLLIGAFIATIIAIWGKTLKNSSKEIRFYRKLTKTGWIAILIAFITLLSGVTKSVVTENQNAEEKKLLFRQLENTQRELSNTKRELLDTKSRINENAQLTEIISEIIGDIPKEIDYSFIQELDERREFFPISSRTGRPLQMYGGDEFEYHIYGRDRWYRDDESLTIHGLILKVGNRIYPLSKFNDKIRIATPIGIPYKISIVCDDGNIDRPHIRIRGRYRDSLRGSSMKIIIHSTDQTRYRQKISRLKALLNND